MEENGSDRDMVIMRDNTPRKRMVDSSSEEEDSYVKRKVRGDRMSVQTDYGDSNIEEEEEEENSEAYEIVKLMDSKKIKTKNCFEFAFPNTVNLKAYKSKLTRGEELRRLEESR